ncbi:MAG TPA: FAD-dependent thymidylate synthase [Acidimicrobiales bacterium]|nr:FAD-dependent thymidylate synthase [Acidimicrobiales bacterium]
MHPYVVETFSDAEADVLRRYFTNLDRPVFALVNLPEVVKGALFARYSRSSKSLRRLFLDEFVGDLDVEGDLTVDATIGLNRAEELYSRVFFEYGDDSVAQLGSVHLACEQASNVLTKVLERGRIMSYLEQSTRYIPYDVRLPNGRYRYYRDPTVLESAVGARYVGDMDRMFDAYGALMTRMQAYFAEAHPREPGDSDFVHRQAVRAKALDATRGLLPAAALSNVGVFGSGQAFEALLLRMRANPLPEVRTYAEMMLEELRKVIPSFLRRLDVPDRGGAWVDYLRDVREQMEQLAATLDGDGPGDDDELVSLVDFDPDGENKVIAAMLYPYTDLPERVLARRVEAMSEHEKRQVVAAYVGDRRNRRHRPGRALERTEYRFDVVSDYGAFRDLQRHRLLTIEWQDLSPTHGYAVPAPVVEAGGEEEYRSAMERSAALHDAVQELFPRQAAYAVALGFKIRYVMQMNAREAMHLIELRSGPQGHPEYRRIAQAMHRLIADVAGHRTIADAMTFVDHTEVGLERLEAERRAASRRRTAGESDPITTP